MFFVSRFLNETFTGMANPGKFKQEVLLKKMRAAGIREEDIIEKFIRSQGKGGQKVNKTSSCVYLKHKPSGIEVKCQRERSQVLNRFLARRSLLNKIEATAQGKISLEQKRIAKIRRQKRKRSKRAKEKNLRDKAKQGQKKAQRSYRPSAEEIET